MVRFGISCDFRNAAKWRVPFPEFYEERLELIGFADRLGFDTVWLTEHHFVEDGYLPAPMPMSAAIAARTSQVAIGQSILLLPFYHPVRLAEEAAVIDNISGGRFMLGVGAGYRKEEFAGYGIPRQNRLSLMEEGLEIVQRAWTEDKFSFEGKRYSLKDVAVFPKPVQAPRPPIWVGSRGDASTERAARFGCHLIPQRGRKQHALYVDSLRRHGYDPQEFRISRTLHCIATYDDPEDVWAELEYTADQEEYRFELYHSWLADAADSDADRSLAHQPVERLRPFIGTPAAVTDHIKEFQERTGCTDVTVSIVPMGRIPQRIPDALQLFAEEVMPRFRS